MRRTLLGMALLGLGIAAGAARVQTQAPATLSFFITSAGSGDGANLGGLAGADAMCQKLGAAAGAGNRTWRAYLSAKADGAQPAVNAKDRIGTGPWYNAKGVMVAQNVADLHSENNKLGKDGSLTEKGAVWNGRGDTPNMHDILTGSRPDGTAYAPAPNLTCSNWTSSGDGAAMVGHHDRTGLVTDPWALSWNASHQTRGCGQEALKSTGGAGLFYCFAAD